MVGNPCWCSILWIVRFRRLTSHDHIFRWAKGGLYQHCGFTLHRNAKTWMQGGGILSTPCWFWQSATGTSEIVLGGKLIDFIEKDVYRQGYMLPFSSKNISIYCRYPGLQDCLGGMTQPISYSKKRTSTLHPLLSVPFFGQKTSNMSPVHVDTAFSTLVTGWQRYAFQWTINEKSYIPSGSEGHLFKLRSGLNFEDMVNQACLGRCLIKPPQKKQSQQGKCCLLPGLILWPFQVVASATTRIFRSHRANARVRCPQGKWWSRW